LVSRKKESLGFEHGEGRNKLTTSHQGSGENRECRHVPEFPGKRPVPWLNLQIRLDCQEVMKVGALRMQMPRMLRM
jgi:hypothetical protein